MKRRACGWFIAASLDGRLEHVAERHDVLGGDAAKVGRAAAADADHGDIELLVEVPAAHDRRRGEGPAAAPATARPNCRRVGSAPRLEDEVSRMMVSPE